jgi:secreted protein with Ig-like and vWFA domain
VLTVASTTPTNEGARRRDRAAGLAVAAVALALGAGAAPAMPLDSVAPGEVPGANEEGELDIREVLDTSTEMDIRLSKQIMLLQRQINDLKQQIEALQAAQAAGN